MSGEKAKKFLEALADAEKSEGAAEVREKLSLIVERINSAPKGSDMRDILNDLAALQKLINSDRKLKALYWIEANALLEAAEFKRTGRRVVFD